MSEAGKVVEVVKPDVCVQPEGTWHFTVTPENMDRIIGKHLYDVRHVAEMVFHQPDEE